MPTLKEIENAVNPADPSLTGLIPVGATAAGGLVNYLGTGAASKALQGGVDNATQTVSDAGAKIPGITAQTLGQQKDLLDPYVSAGVGAENMLSSGIQDGSLTAPFVMDYNQVRNDPGYQFELAQTIKQANAAAGARGLWNSGGTIRNIADYSGNVTDKYTGQIYSRSENTFNTNKAQRLSAIQQLAGTGQAAANTESAAVGHAGDQNVQGVEWTATQISDLQQAKADAIAAGDLGKAKSISDTLAGIANQVSDSGVLAGLKKIYGTSGATNPATAPSGVDANGQPFYNAVAPAAQTLGGLTGPALTSAFNTAAGASEGILGAGSGLPAASTLTGAMFPGEISATLPEVNSVAASAGAPAAGGFAHAAVGFLTNPITIGVGAAILAATAWLKSQAHWEANTLTKGVQKDFGANLGKVVDGFDNALASGQLNKATAQQMRDQTAALINDFNQKVTDFSKKGSDERKVALQAMQTMADNFGARADYPNLPSYDKILGKMDAEIQQLQGAA